MVGLAFEVHDSYDRKRKTLKLNEKINESLKKKLDSSAVVSPRDKDDTPELESDTHEKMTSELTKLKLEMEFISLDPRPSILHVFMYAYCHIGLLTGPYFKYRTYSDWLVNRNLHEIDSVSFMWKRGRVAPFIVAGFLILSRFVSFKVKLRGLKSIFIASKELISLFRMHLKIHFMKQHSHIVCSI